MPTPTPDTQLGNELVEKLRLAHWVEADDRLGMHSYGYTKAEQQAIDIVVEKAAELGMESFSDLVGNVYLIKRGSGGGKKTDVIVSHLDTVERGGAHDGRDGIAAGLAVVSGLNKAGVKPEHDICVMIARSEESCINGQVSIGAKAATGGLSSDKLGMLSNRKDHKRVLEHMTELGIPIAQMPGRLDATPTLFPTGADAKNLIGFLAEAHIEQGEYCAKKNVELGIVEAIRGNTRYKDITITGEAAHSGAAFEEDRADALRAYNKLMARAEAWFEDKHKKGYDIVYTPFEPRSSHGSTNTIVDKVTCSLEIRSKKLHLLEEFDEFMKTAAQDIMKEHAERSKTSSNPRKLTITLPKANITKPAGMDKSLIEHTQKLAKDLGINAGVVTSGAGHDTAQFANTGGNPCLMLFIKQDKPISHNPAEARRADSFAHACHLLTAMVMNPMPEKETAAESKGSFTDYLKQQGATPYRAGSWQAAADKYEKRSEELKYR